MTEPRETIKEKSMNTEQNTMQDSSPQERFLHGIIMLAIYGSSVLGMILLLWWLFT
jgi:hypothetical protein